jgi:hypothetical protein
MKVFLKILNNFLFFIYLGLVTIDLFKTIYPETFQIYITNIGYKVIYYYSKTQIIIKNVYDNLPENIKDILFSVYVYFYHSGKNKNDNMIEVVFEGHIINKFNKNNIDKLLNINYDFILCSKTLGDLTHKRIIYAEDNLDINDETLFVCEPSEIKFIMTEIILQDKKFNIDFKINNHNYYVCDNIFNSKFIIYFLNEYYSQEIKEISLDKLLNYEVLLLDENVRQKMVDFKDSIKINKNGYTIFTK